jgi:hypothetical protein
LEKPERCFVYGGLPKVAKSPPYNLRLYGIEWVNISELAHSPFIDKALLSVAEEFRMNGFTFTRL